jgi:hypothetical protein
MCDSEAKKARAEAHKAQGNEEYKKGDYAAAVVHYSRAIGTIFPFYKWAFWGGVLMAALRQPFFVPCKW